jgi:hypothetical protein
MSLIKKKPKMVDPARYPKVTSPIDLSVRTMYSTMLKSMVGMMQVELLKTIKEDVTESE